MKKYRNHTLVDSTIKIQPYQTLSQACQGQNAPKISRSSRAEGSTLIKYLVQTTTCHLTPAVNSSFPTCV